MDIITLTIGNAINVSLRLDDIIYYCLTTLNNDGDPIKSGDFIKLGKCTAIDYDNNSLSCEIPSADPRPPTGSYIFFSKDNKIHSTSMLGYYADVKMVNDDPDAAEIFGVGSEIFVSSK